MSRQQLLSPLRILWIRGVPDPPTMLSRGGAVPPAAALPALLTAYKDRLRHKHVLKSGGNLACAPMSVAATLGGAVPVVSPWERLDEESDGCKLAAPSVFVESTSKYVDVNNV